MSWISSAGPAGSTTPSGDLKDGFGARGNGIATRAPGVRFERDAVLGANFADPTRRLAESRWLSTRWVWTLAIASGNSAAVVAVSPSPRPSSELNALISAA